jgi:hypothetical protein
MKKDNVATIRINTATKAMLKEVGVTPQMIIDTFVSSNIETKTKRRFVNDVDFFREGVTVAHCDWCHEEKLTIDTGASNVCKQCIINEEA